MIDPSGGIPDVGADETLARYVLQRSHIRATTQTVKPDAFVPHPHRELSVTRHLMATEEELWLVGEDVAEATGKRLYGRADIAASVCAGQQLRIQPDPVANNPNHANVHGWPADKPAQKAIAQELAAEAAFVPKE